MNPHARRVAYSMASSRMLLNQSPVASTHTQWQQPTGDRHTGSNAAWACMREAWPPTEEGKCLRLYTQAQEQEGDSPQLPVMTRAFMLWIFKCLKDGCRILMLFWELLHRCYRQTKESVWWQSLLLQIFIFYCDVMAAFSGLSAATEGPYVTAKPQKYKTLCNLLC